MRAVWWKQVTIPVGHWAAGKRVVNAVVYMAVEQARPSRLVGRRDVLLLEEYCLDLLHVFAKDGTDWRTVLKLKPHAFVGGQCVQIMFPFLILQVVCSS
jgi:hypothetical protein